MRSKSDHQISDMAAYSWYFGHPVPVYAVQRYDRETLHSMLDEALVKGEPIKEFANYPKFPPKTPDQAPPVAQFSQEERDSIRKEYLASRLVTTQPTKVRYSILNSGANLRCGFNRCGG